MSDKSAKKVIDEMAKFWKDNSMTFSEMKALEQSSKALEKQIPQKVFNNSYGVYFCPSCKGSVWQNKDESKYCFRCGQKLDCE